MPDRVDVGLVVGVPDLQTRQQVRRVRVQCDRGRVGEIGYQPVKTLGGRSEKIGDVACQVPASVQENVVGIVAPA